MTIENTKENRKIPVIQILNLITVLSIITYVIYMTIYSKGRCYEIMIAGAILALLALIFGIITFKKPKLLLLNLIAYIPITICGIIAWFPEFIMNGAIRAYDELEMWLITLIWMLAIFCQVYLIVTFIKNKKRNTNID